MDISKLLNLTNIKAQSADLRIYGDIVGSEWDVWEGTEVFPQMVQDHLAQVDGKDLNIYINSAGGSVFAGLQIFNSLKRHNGTLTVHIDGVAASIASVIALVGKVVIPDNAYMMIHKPLLSYTAGNAKELREQAEMLDKIFDGMMAIYQGRLTDPDKADAFIAMCDNETWLTASEVAELFTDVEVIKSNRAVALCSNEIVASLTKVPKNLQVVPEGESVDIDNAEPVKEKGGQPDMMTIEEIKAAIEAGDIKAADIKALIVKEGETIVEAKSLKVIEALGEYNSIQAIDTLKAEAEHGRKYLSDLIEAALVERKRAQGDLFTPEMSDRYKTMLARTADIDTIKDEIELYKKQVEDAFTKGRQTDGAEPSAEIRRSVLFDKKGDK